MALSPNSLARRKPGVQIPSPPPHNSPGRRLGGHLLWAGVLSELLPGQQTGSNLERNGQPLLEARQGCACLFPRAIAETPLPHGRSYTLAECESTLELEPQAGVKIPSFVRGEAAGGHGLSASTAPSSRLHASPIHPIEASSGRSPPAGEPVSTFYDRTSRKLWARTVHDPAPGLPGIRRSLGALAGLGLWRDGR
jgi:hypothetical protein